MHLALHSAENKLNTHIQQSIALRIARFGQVLARKASRERACKKLQQNNPIPGESFIPGIGLFCSLIEWAAPPTINPLETKIHTDYLATEKFIYAINNHPVENRRINW